MTNRRSCTAESDGALKAIGSYPYISSRTAMTNWTQSTPTPFSLWPSEYFVPFQDCISSSNATFQSITRLLPGWAAR